tara:strand:+ start:7480 stop:7893 length:414 start_codon:yes stop_codon:yes gene_type:complete
MNSLFMIQTKAKLFVIESKLKEKSDDTTLLKKKQKYKKKIAEWTRQENQNANDVTNIMLQTTWTRLKKQLKADRLYIYSMEQNLTLESKKKLFQLFKKDLDDRVLTKKKEVEYDEKVGKITALINIDKYIEQIVNAN